MYIYIHFIIEIVIVIEHVHVSVVYVYMYMICVSVYDCLCIQIYAHIRIYKCMYWGSSKILKASAIVQGEASIYVQGGETWPAASVFLHAMQSKTKASPSPSLSWHLWSSLVLTCDLHWFAVKVCAGVWAGCGGMETQIPFGPLTWKESPIVLLSESLPGGEVDWLLVTPSILNIRSALGVFCRASAASLKLRQGFEASGCGKKCRTFDFPFVAKTGLCRQFRQSFAARLPAGAESFSHFIAFSLIHFCPWMWCMSCICRTYKVRWP